MSLLQRQLTRRSVLGGLVAAGLAGPRLGRAVEGSGRRFVFVWSDGGWDPLCVFAPMFGRRDIEMERRADPWSPAGLPVVDHPDRPTVRGFFEQYAARCSLVHGLSVPSVSHDVCALLTFTGSGGGEAPDWPSRLANAGAASYVLPSVVISGPSFPADQGVITSRVGAAGQLGALVDGSIRGSRPALSASAAAKVDALLERTARPGSDPLVADWVESQRRANELFAVGDELALGAVVDPASRVRAAVQTLATGLSRCVTIGSPYGLYWDSHANNESVQSYAYEELFGALHLLAGLLATTPSPQGGVLLDDTVVVCLSEMGRTPRFNSGAGRDHWPFTSAMLFGGGVPGGRVVSGYDDGFNGLGCDPTTGDIDAAAESLTPANLGATLLALADIDPSETLPGVAPIGPLGVSA